MKKIAFLVAIALLAGCASPSGGGSTTTPSGGGGGGGNADDPFAADHNGTWDLPVGLTLNQDFSGKIGSSTETVTGFTQFPGYNSYYHFAKGAAVTTVAVSITGSSPAHLTVGTNDFYYGTLYGPGGINGPAIGSTALITDNIAPLFSVDTASGEYGLLVSNSLNQNTTYTLRVGATPTLNEGTVGLPVSLGLNSGYSAITSSLGSSTSGSFYTFHLNSTATVTITYDTTFLDAYLYSDTGFNTLVKSEASQGTKNLTTDTPLAAGDYFLNMRAAAVHDSKISYTLTVTTP